MTFTCKDLKEVAKKAKALNFAFNWKVEYFVTGNIKGKCHFDSNGHYGEGEYEEFFAYACRTYNLDSCNKGLIVENTSFYTKRYTVKDVSSLAFHVRMRSE